MPVVFRDGPSVLFYSNEGLPREPAHIHVKGRGCIAKVWIESEIAIADSYGFNSRELADILKVVSANRDRITKAGHDHFGD